MQNLSERLGVNRVVLALSTARMADALGNSMMIVVLPLYVADLPSPLFNLPTPVLVGLLISFYGITNTILQPVMGAVSDRMATRKRMILIGLMLMAAGTTSFIFASQFSQLLLIRLMQGLGVAMTVPASLALMTAATVRASRGGSMGLYSTMRLVGFSIGPLLGGLLYELFGFVAVFVVGGSMVALSALLVLAMVDESQLAPRPARKAGEVFRVFDRSIWTKEVLGLGAATVMMALSYSMMASLENEFNARLGQTALGFGFAFSALTVGRMLIQFPVGRLSDRLGRKPVIIGGLIAMAPATIFLGYAGSTLALAGGRFLQGVASAAIAAPALALVGDISPVGGEARQMSVITTGFFVGQSIGPLIAGGLVLYAFQLPFIVGGALSLLGAFIVFTLVPETVVDR